MSLSADEELLKLRQAIRLLLEFEEITLAARSNVQPYFGKALSERIKIAKARAVRPNTGGVMKRMAVSALTGEYDEAKFESAERIVSPRR